VREIIVSERDSYESWRGHKQRKPLTCVIGARGADGCAIVADTRAMREYEASNISKFHILWDRVAIAGAGTSVLLDKFAEGIQKSEIPSAPDFGKVVETIEDIVGEVSTRYQTRLGPDSGLEALIMGLENFDKGEPYLRIVYQQGITEDIGQFAIIGHGAPYAHPLYRLLYDPMLTANELAVLGYFVISTIVYLGLDQTVGMTQMGPECVILRANEEPKFLNPLDDEFKTARASLENLKFRANLITSIWQKIPMASSSIFPENSRCGPRCKNLGVVRN